MTEEQLKDVNKALNYMGIENVQNIIIIGNGATNGDIIKAMFPNIEDKEKAFEIEVNVNKNKVGNISADWWNAPYRKVVE